MKTFIKKENYMKIFFLLFILIIPWSISDVTDSISAEKITSDLAFYEINPCKVSLTEFLLKNIKVNFTFLNVVNKKNLFQRLKISIFF